MGVLQGTRQYFHRVGMLSRNARLYLLATALQGLSGGIWGVIFNIYLKRVGFLDNFIGNVFTASAIATGLVALPAGFFCERFGPRRALLVGLTSNFVSLILAIFLDPSALLLASFASGLIGTIYGVAGAPFMMENSEREERTHLFSLSWTFMIIMGVIGGFVGGIMPDLFNTYLGLPTGTEIGSPIGYRITLIISIILALSAVIPLFLIREKKAERQKVGTLFHLGNIKSPRTIIKFMIPTALIGFGAGFIVPLFNIFFYDKFFATSAQIGVIYAWGNVTLGVGTLIAPVLSNRLGKVRSVAFCEFLSLPFIMLITVSPNLSVAASAYIFRGAFMNMAGPISTTLQMELVSETERATTSGLMVMADNIPRAMTASISGEMMTKKDFFTPFVITTVTYVIASALYFIFFRNAEKKKSAR
ncbi:MAG TPA: MFS transporter [Candidatus Krumholzibacteriaceae bacterium]|nr:MFS transporter [Candidatus Krumholzibacteriaceae bacterium]